MSSAENLARWIELPADLLAAAQEQLHEPAASECIARVQDLLRQVQAAGIPFTTGWFSYSPEGFAVSFLRWAKWEVPKALARIKAMDKWHKDALSDVDPLSLRGKDFQSLFDIGALRALGRQAHTGCLIQLLRPTLFGDKLTDPRIMIKYNAWLLQRSIYNKRLQVHGMAMLETFEGFTFSEAMKFNKQMKPVMSLQMKFMNECAPYRMTCLAMVHEPVFLSFLLALAKPFMSKKMKSRIRMFGKNMNKLHADLADASVLPADFGGTNPDNGEALWAQTLKEEERSCSQGQQLLSDDGISRPHLLQ